MIGLRIRRADPEILNFQVFRVLKNIRNYKKWPNFRSSLMKIKRKPTVRESRHWSLRKATN